MKTCSHCKCLKDNAAFRKDHRTSTGLTSWCRTCMQQRALSYYHANKTIIGAQLKQRRLKNPAHYRDKERKWRRSNMERGKGKILQKYWPGVTWRQALENYKVLVEKQNNLCGICKKPEYRLANTSSNNKIRDLCVDHCHATGTVRGLLCDDCNVLLGRAKDDPTICINACNYLKTHKRVV